MKKKNILTILIIFVSVLTLNVFAKGSDIGSDSDGYTGGITCAKSNPYCWMTNVTGNDVLQGVRVTIVDENGNKMSGKSVDYVNDSNHLNLINQTYNLTISTGAYAGYTNQKYYRYSSKKHKNAFVKSSGSYSLGKADAKLLSDLPDFMEKGINDNVRNYFLGQGKSGMEKFYNDLNYNYKLYRQNGKIYDHYVLVEPLLVVTITNNSTKSIKRYYGTVTEVTQMLSNTGDLSKVPASYFVNTLASSIYVRDKSPKGTDVVAGLNRVTPSGINTSNYKSKILSNNGYAAGHIWIKEIENGGNNGNQTCDDYRKIYNEEDLCKYHPECGCPSDDLCNFDLKVDIPNNCDVKTKGSIKDVSNWSCIYQSTTSKKSTIQNHFFQFSNAYCAVYCREEITYEFPDSSTRVLAGSRFTLGNSGYFPNLSPVYFKSVTNCRPTNQKSDDSGIVNHTQFVKDWDEVNRQIREAWDKYQIALANMDAFNNAKRSGGGNCYRTVCSSGADGKQTCHKVVSGSYSTYKGSSRYNGNSYSQSYNTGCKDNKSSKKSSLQSKIDSTKNTYDDLITKKNNILKALKTCNNFQYTNRNFKPTVYFQYEEAIYGGKSYTLAGTVDISSYTKYSDTNTTKKWSTSSYKNASTDFITSDYGVYGKSGTVIEYTCKEGSANNRKPCNQYIYTKYPTNNKLEQTTTKEYSYTLPAGVYRYVIKPSGESFNTAGEAANHSANYFDIGYSNLPVHYSRKDGDYMFELDYSSFGPNHRFNKFIFNGELVNISYGENLDIYSYLWNNRTLNSLINHCGQSGNHLGHNFVSAIGSRLNEFLSSSCAEQHNCQMSGSKKVICNKYKDESGNWRTASSRSFSSTSYTTYNQLRACIQGKVVSTQGNAAFNGKTKYGCEYHVDNKIIPKPDYRGLNVIYRPISLDNPFPGISGKGRTPGDNWNSKYLIDTYITNNRNTTTYKIYNELDPMYKITLTPALIKEIRKYNEEQKNKKETYYDATAGRVTGIAGYADFNMNCDENGRNCKSNFLRKSIGSYNFSKYVTGCGISGKNTGLTCNKGESW